MDELWLRHAVGAKRDGRALEAATWRRIVNEYVADRLDEAALAALAMACVVRGMEHDEITALTAAMVDSGEVLRYRPGRTVVDKHSSGGVGDTVSLIVVPLVAACGVPVAKLSGRALGHTGGTLDKLEAIPGVRTDLTPEEFVAQVEGLGCAVAAQSGRLAPADRKLYALRDRTATVPALGLIASSIVSKKIAGGAGAMVFDVKCGRGAFTPTMAEATLLARTLVRLCGAFERRASALISDMDEPLGCAIGSGLEAIEAREFLRGGQRDARLHEAALAVAGEMLRVGGVPEHEVAPRALGALESGAAYETFVSLIEAQGGTRRALEDLAPHPRRTVVSAPRDGVVTAIDAVLLGESARALVAAHGPAAGVRTIARVGTAVRHGEALAEVLGGEPGTLAAAFELGERAPEPRALIAAVLRDEPPQRIAGAVR